MNIEKGPAEDPRFSSPRNAEELAALEKIMASWVIFHDKFDAPRDERVKRGRPAVSWHERLIRSFFYRALHAWRLLNAMNLPVPDSMLEPYRIGVERFERENTHDKYRIRPYNLLREYLRIACLSPELLVPECKETVLDLSSGSCGTFELMRNTKVTVSCADALSRDDGTVPFAPFWEELGVEIIPFDGRQRPFPFESKSFDVVLCSQAIDAFGQPETYPESIAEICRIARRKAVIILNYKPHKTPREDTEAALNQLNMGPEWHCRRTNCPEIYGVALILTRDPANEKHSGS